MILGPRNFRSTTTSVLPSFVAVLGVWRTGLQGILALVEI